MLTPIADWRAVLKHAWSVRLIALSILFSALEVAVQFLHGVLPVSDGVFAILASLTTVAAMGARFIAQLKVHPEPLDWDAGKVSVKKGLIAGSLALTVLATGIISQFEGRELRAYQDIVGVWTICDGETKGVKASDVATPAECDGMLARNLVLYEAGIDKCLVGAVPGKVKVAFLSLAYNIGTGAFCKSTLVRKANAGDLRGACDQLLVWNRAGGRMVKGLSNRREAERTLCLEGLAT